MTKDDIIRMARAASGGTDWWPLHTDTLEKFAALVAAAEREACVQTLERLIGGDGIVAEDGVWVHDCVAALRARGAAPKAKP